MKFRKFLCFVLIFAIMVSLGVTAFADGIALHGNSSIAAITNDEFEALFGTGNADAEYNYNVSRTIKDDIFHVSMSATISVGENDYLLTAAGDVDLLELTDGSSILNGPLYGEISIGEINLPLTAGFTKSVGENKINAGIVINPLIDSDAQILFAFGERVMADDVDVVRPISEVKTDSELFEEPAVFASVPQAVFRQVSTRTVSMANMSSVNGQKLTVYYASNARRAGARVQTFTSAISSYYTNMGNKSCKVRVNKITIKLTRGSANLSYIDGIDEITNGNFQQGNNGFAEMVLAILSDFGIPTATFEAALKALSGNTTSYYQGSYGYVTSKFSSSCNTNVLNNSGMAVTFNITNNSGTSHSAAYTFSSQAEYNISYYTTLSGSTSFYASANSASLVCSFSV